MFPLNKCFIIIPIFLRNINKNEDKNILGTMQVSKISHIGEIKETLRYCNLR